MPSMHCCKLIGQPGHRATCSRGTEPWTARLGSPLRTDLSTEPSRRLADSVDRSSVWSSAVYCTLVGPVGAGFGCAAQNDAGEPRAS